MVIGTVPCNLGGEAAKFGRQTAALVSLSGCWSTAQLCLKYKQKKKERWGGLWEGGVDGALATR